MVVVNILWYSYILQTVNSCIALAFISQNSIQNPKDTKTRRYSHTVFIYTRVCACMYVCVYVCVCVCVYVYCSYRQDIIQSYYNTRADNSWRSETKCVCVCVCTVATDRI